jgi:farnesyl-diphosphate farnesyltransferase
MSIPLDKKCEMLLAFYDKTERKHWSLTGRNDASVATMCDVSPAADGEKPAERDLLAHYFYVGEIFLGLKKEYRDTITEICKRMGAGMAEFTRRDVLTVADYELYCHYVAGLVGIGLSRLFGNSNLEAASFAHASTEPLANAMGLFLQKTNITRDYREDVDQQPPRVFYPRAIWSLYGDSIDAFKRADKQRAGVRCVNHMITDALRHAPASIEYLAKLRHPDVFRFCAIPQVMAIATLERCYNNADVLTGAVKIRKGEALQLIADCGSFKGTLRAFDRYAARLESRIDTSDPNASATRTHIRTLQQSIAQFSQ